LSKGLITRTQALQQKQADNDAQVIEIWAERVRGHTAHAYRADAGRLLAFLDGTPLRAVSVADLQEFCRSRSLKHLSESSRVRVVSSIKSLFAFAHKLGYIPFDPSAVVKLPRVKNKLAERILPESEVHRLFTFEPDPRNKVLLKVLYYSGSRVSEVCGLRWGDLQARGDKGQMTVFGKGGKTRAILLPPTLWAELMGLRGEAAPQDPVFVSRNKRGAISACQVLRIVRAAAHRIGIKQNVSPHWLRHAHASHSLDHGAPISLVQATLGHSSVATTGKYLHARPSESSSKYLSE
jgi:site-specific recombinase XerD